MISSPTEIPTAQFPIPRTRARESRPPAAYDSFVSPKSKPVLAREHLERALPAVAAEDYTEAVTWLFAALEAAVAAIAEQKGIDIEPKHWRKAEVASDLLNRGAITLELAPALRTLNEARKEAVYEGEEPDLDGQSLEDLAADVEAAVELAEDGAS